MYYLIKGTQRGEQIVFRGERSVLLFLAQHLRRQSPRITVRITNRPVDLFGNYLLPHAGR